MLSPPPPSPRRLFASRPEALPPCRIAKPTSSLDGDIVATVESVGESKPSEILAAFYQLLQFLDDFATQQDKLMGDIEAVIAENARFRNGDYASITANRDSYGGISNDCQSSFGTMVAPSSSNGNSIVSASKHHLAGICENTEAPITPPDREEKKSRSEDHDGVYVAAIGSIVTLSEMVQSATSDSCNESPLRKPLPTTKGKGWHSHARHSDKRHSGKASGNRHSGSATRPSSSERHTSMNSEAQYRFSIFGALPSIFHKGTQDFDEAKRIKSDFQKELEAAKRNGFRKFAPWQCAPWDLVGSFAKSTQSFHHIGDEYGTPRMSKREQSRTCSNFGSEPSRTSKPSKTSKPSRTSKRLTERSSDQSGVRVADSPGVIWFPSGEYDNVEEMSWAQRIVSHPSFYLLCSIMILGNSVLIGISTDYLTTNEEETFIMTWVGHGCSLFFFVELILRVLAERTEFFRSDDRIWNAFDLLLVLFSIFDVVMDSMAPGSQHQKVSAMKTIKMLRIVRIFRVFRFCKELTVLAMMITQSMKSLMWALVMLSLIMYVFAICFVSGATQYLSGGDISQRDVLIYRFGSLSRAVNSLLLSMLGGVSWGEISEPLESVGWVLVALFFFYIFFTMFAVLNIITGVFVDNAVQTANNQREFLVQKEMELKEKYLTEMHKVFEDMDDDRSGTLSMEELRKYFNDERVNSYFQVLGLDPDDSERLFRLLDKDDSGEINAVEFLDGCLRLKGDARSIDVHTIMSDCRAILREVRQLTEHFNLERRRKTIRQRERRTMLIDKVITAQTNASNCTGGKMSTPSFMSRSRDSVARRGLSDPQLTSTRGSSDAQWASSQEDVEASL